MRVQPPKYYFRPRENGATVFRIDVENPAQRIDMKPIAVVNHKNGDIRPQGDTKLSNDDKAEIKAWLAARKDKLDRDQMDDLRDLVDRLGLAAHWAQHKATPEALDQVADKLLFAMHDLRTVLTRKAAQSIEKSND